MVHVCGPMADLGCETLEALTAVIREALAVVRAALVDWPVTARLCVILTVAATTICTTALVLR
jgi:hypothetical protein